MHEDYWKSCRKFIKKEIEIQSYKTWFKPIKAIEFNNKTLTLEVPNKFFYEWIEEHYLELLNNTINKVLGSNGKIEYKINNHLVDKKIVEKKQKFEKSELSTNYSSNLNLNYTFENFIGGKCNNFAKNAGISVSTNPGITPFNPLMIFGGVGQGKTHLLHSIGNNIHLKNQKNRILYTTSEKFTSQFISALRSNTVQDFTDYYLGVDSLMIDDIQFLRGKEKTQEIFFHIFNHLNLNKKQIIITSDRAPKYLDGLKKRLVSRFKWGLTVKLEKPDFETRIKILQHKILSNDIKLSKEVIEYIAFEVDTNVRELEGVIISLIAHATIEKSNIDLKLAKKVIGRIVKDTNYEIDIDFIQNTIANFYKITKDEMKDKIRKKEIVIARQVAMYFSKDYTNNSLKSIGFHFGGRDHSTVIHAVQSVNDMIDTDIIFKKSINEINKRLSSN